jgi:hypothetical protein
VVASIIDKHIVKSKPNITKISIDVNSAVLPFAQNDMALSFVYGIDPSLQQEIQNRVGSLLTKTAVALAQIISKDPAQQHVFTTALSGSIEILKQQFIQEMNDSIRYRHVDPILNGVASLPPDDLATMAETLVNLTSFKRKISANERETVGGPTDVAVISIGVGFVWIKRKHYFPPETNHHFFSNYYQPSEES